MTEHDADPPATGGEASEAADETRKTRSIRFTDAEWREVRGAAERHGVPAAEFVRDTILAAARGDHTPSLAALAPLIERTFRYSWMLATHKRYELDEAGRGAEMETLVEEARKLQDRLQDRGSAGGAPDATDAPDDDA